MSEIKFKLIFFAMFLIGVLVGALVNEYINRQNKKLYEQALKELEKLK